VSLLGGRFRRLHDLWDLNPGRCQHSFPAAAELRLIGFPKMKKAVDLRLLCIDYHFRRRQHNFCLVYVVPTRPVRVLNNVDQATTENLRGGLAISKGRCDTALLWIRVTPRSYHTPDFPQSECRHVPAQSSHFQLPGSNVIGLAARLLLALSGLSVC
jgi:hypothetical protein